MKPQELRIGNWVLDRDNKEAQVTSLTVGGIREEIKPIKLTPEWLEKFEWKQLDKYTWTKNGWFVYLRKRGFVTGSKKREIKLPYVHTLQNWYALTGKELKRNPA